MILSVPLDSAIVLAVASGAGSTLAAITATRIDIGWIKKTIKNMDGRITRLEVDSY